MKNYRLRIIGYRPRTEKLTPREWWEKAPNRFGVLAVLFLNCAICACIIFLVRGWAIGTRPSMQGYVVETQGRLTPVRKPFWFFSLFYTSATILITPLAVVLIVATFLRGLFGDRAPVCRAALVFCPFYLPLAYTVFSNMVRSMLDAWGLDALWPNLSRTIGCFVVVAVLILALGAYYERKKG